MLKISNNQIKQEISNLLDLEKARPYVFRTRLERVLLKVSNFASTASMTDLKIDCENLRDKLHYISDHSNQTSDGTLKSFTLLKQDIINLMGKVS